MHICAKKVASAGFNYKKRLSRTNYEMGTTCLNIWTWFLVEVMKDIWYNGSTYSFVPNCRPGKGDRIKCTQENDHDYQDFLKSYIIYI